MVEQDPDVLQWGLQFFEYPYFNCRYVDATRAYNTDYYDGQCFVEDHYDAEFCSIENDELIANTLQQELSQLAVVEVPESPHGGEENLKIPVYQEEWRNQPLGNYVSGEERGQDELDDLQSSSFGSSPEEESYCDEEWSYPIELIEDYALDGEVGKRLNQMVPVPHVPRINGEIPSVDEATLDHQRLLERLLLYDLVECKVQGDGNCQFRSLSDQIYQTPEHHEFLRQQVVNQLKSFPEIYEGYVPMAYGDYLEKMSKSGEWGDHVTLQAAADLYGVKIFVITSFKDTCYIEILPNVERSNRVIYLSFWAEVHYNSIYPSGDVPVFETKKKKRWRFFRNKQLESSNEHDD